MKRGYFRTNGERSGNEILSALTEAGVRPKEIYHDLQGNAALQRLLGQLEPGDTLVVHRIPDVGNTIDDLFRLAGHLQRQNVGLRSLGEPWFQLTGANPHGQALMAVIEHLYLHYRTASSEIAVPAKEVSKKAGSRSVGRPRGARKSLQPKLDAALKLYKDNQLAVDDICRRLDLNERTFYRYLKLHRPDIPPRPKGRKRKNAKAVAVSHHKLKL